ncbi:hypothetical protein ES332_D11G040100v1 [Gossypium tomentosum]|uniref:beta-aspartyl-peptidase n=1 Tax=Gossypium tomentosum TaxID=34277 RepID=A0A5D2IIV8_GOSTO|nr:hypothetical protein ES332_D11G040100v1 [Gossypium tomentosum]
MGWAIALHGGAGDIPHSLPPDRRLPREAGLRHCLDVGIAALKAHKHPLDVVELVVRELENYPHFNAGKGSVLTSSGTVEMEASIMDGKSKKCGAVSSLSTVVNAVSLARLVMEKTPHIYLGFHGAEAFAREQKTLKGLSRHKMLTEFRYERGQRRKSGFCNIHWWTSEQNGGSNWRFSNNRCRDLRQPSLCSFRNRKRRSHDPWHCRKGCRCCYGIQRSFAQRSCGLRYRPSSAGQCWVGRCVIDWRNRHGVQYYRNVSCLCQ